MYDFHIHSDFSIDSKASMDSMCISAIEKKLKGVCFTDHIDLEVTKDKLDFQFRVPDYLRSIKSMKYRYKEKIDVFTGIEIGMQDGLEDRYEKILESGDFDFVIMSVHNLGGDSEFVDDFLKNIDPLQGLSVYYQTLYECVKSFNNYDVLGHIDFIDRYFDNEGKIPKYDQVFPIIEDILKIVIENDKGIEINTAGIQYGLDSPHPKLSILKLYRDLGGKIVTIGSDAHSPDFIGENFKLAKSTLKKLGFEYSYIYDDRKKIPMKL